mgnify:CR=1 FL=1
MDVSLSGEPGAHAARRVMEERNCAIALAPTHHLQMAGKHASDQERRHKVVMSIYAALILERHQILLLLLLKT